MAQLEVPPLGTLPPLTNHPPKGRKFHCPLCPKIFVQKRSSEIHIHSKHGEEVEGNLSCPVCLKEFDAPSHLSMHLINKHTGQFVCEVPSCKVSFPSEELLASHKFVHDSNNATFSSCDFCLEVFNSKLDVETHQRIHLKSPQKFLCQVCGHAFPSYPLLADHMLVYHSRQPGVFPCLTCSKTFRSNTNLKIHQRIHSGDRPYKCDLCDFASRQSTPLKLHKRKHTGVMPYGCDYCSAPGFSNVKSLRLHLAQTHPDSNANVSKFVCKICWKDFEDESQLREHAVKHDKYKCEVCGVQFKQMSHLKEHLFRHGDIRPFECPFCLPVDTHITGNKSFLRRKALVDHIMEAHPTEDFNNLNLQQNFEFNFT